MFKLNFDNKITFFRADGFLFALCNIASVRLSNFCSTKISLKLSTCGTSNTKFPLGIWKLFLLVRLTC